MYKPTKLELYISNIFQEHIKTIEDLSIRKIAEVLDIEVRYADFSATVFNNNKRLIVLSEEKNYSQQYNRFIHEVAHILLEQVSFHKLVDEQIKYIEGKTNHIMQYIAIPYFMLDKLHELCTIEEISEYFNVSYEIALNRMEKIKYRQRCIS
jgi:Zn-dependent peptidase ImmA (M78 family)